MHHWTYTTGLILTSILCSVIFLMLITYFYDFKSFLSANLSNQNEKSIITTKILLNLFLLSIYLFKEVELYDDAENDVAFASTTTGELKEYLENNPGDSDVLIGLENFRRRNTVNKKVD